MILYGVITDEGEEFFPSAKAAIRQAKGFGEVGNHYVVCYDIGKVNKAKICLLASGRGFAEFAKSYLEREGRMTYTLHTKPLPESEPKLLRAMALVESVVCHLMDHGTVETGTTRSRMLIDASKLLRELSAEEEPQAEHKPKSHFNKMVENYLKKLESEQREKFYRLGLEAAARMAESYADQCSGGSGLGGDGYRNLAKAQRRIDPNKGY